MLKDSVVEEVRKAGMKIQDECGNDLHSFAARLKRNTEKLKKEGWPVISKSMVLKSRNKAFPSHSSCLLKVSEDNAQYGEHR
ncbi:MAG TPA: hypothetical protein DCZ94_07380 [Lentisphaeria bacterium]|nr:MAG: hypothetical protein A2X48_20525 [Lentisphaerae bacterium GWF2_49_21]HBC86757.1 hypothetical protein [Lentisphaeria bacterium]